MRYTIIKYAIIIISCISIILGIYYAGYYRGDYVRSIKDNIKSKELSIDLLTKQNKQKDLIISNERKNQEIINNQSLQWESQYNAMHNKYIIDKRNWDAKQKHINDTNTITNEWVQYVTKSTSTTMPFIPSNASESNDTAYNIGSSIKDQREQCELELYRFAKLQQTIKQVTDNFNKDR